MVNRGDSRGLSAIIATLLIIIITFVAVAIIWIVVKNVIQSGTEQVSLGKFTLNLEIKSATIDPATPNYLLVRLKRNPGEGEISGLKFILEDGDTTEVVEVSNYSMKQLEERTFNISLSEISNASNIIKISVAPIFQLESGKEITGDVKDEYNVPKTSVSGGTPCVPNCAGKQCGSNGCGGSCGTCTAPETCNSTGQCIPCVPNCAGRACGPDPVCGQSCGTCTAPATCNSTGQCVITCTPATCASLGKNCGTWANGTCAGTLDCGTCTAPATCNSTGQCVVSAPAWQNGLILWLKLDGNADDSSPYHWSTNDDDITYVSGISGQGATGFSDTTEITVDEDLDYASTDMTISFWMNVVDYTSPSRQNPIGKAYGGDGTFTLEPGGEINFYFGASGVNGQPYTSDGTSDSATAGTWEHWAIVRDRTARTTQWYKNAATSGSLRTYDSTYDPVHSTYDLDIGDSYVNPLNGVIDEVMIWNRTLSSTEIQQVHDYF